MPTSFQRAVWLDYLRSFLTVLVVAHHAALAYPTFAQFNPSLYIASTAPIVDLNRWLVFDWLIGFNDVFFMPALFFISGLFVIPSLCRKGVIPFLTDRAIRLGIPFLVAELLIIPLAYVPSFYVATGSTDARRFITDYLGPEQWPVGPPWFIWLLLVFNGVAAFIYSIRSTLFTALGGWLARLAQRPARFGLVLYGSVALTLIPLSLWVGQYTWVGRWGPFDFQLNRLPFYFLFFLIGTGFGSVSWQSFLFRFDTFLGWSWPSWLLVSVGGYALLRWVAEFGRSLVQAGALHPLTGYALFDLVFVLSCLASLGACFSAFEQNVTQPDRYWQRLSANAYGIYLLHYPFVTWLQFLLLDVIIPAGLKFLLVLVGALTLSWLSTSLLRKANVIKL